MDFTDQSLARIALGLAVFGLVLLSVIALISEPTKIPLHALNEELLEEKISVQGIIKWSKLLKGNTLLFSLADELYLNEINCVYFSPPLKERNLWVKGVKVEVQGKLKKYKGELEIVVEKIVLSDA